MAGSEAKFSESQHDSGFGSSVYRKITDLLPEGDLEEPHFGRRATDRFLDQKSAETRRATKSVRVRLYIAIPVLMVLVLVLMAGALFHTAITHFGSLAEFASFSAIFLMILIGFSVLAAVVGSLVAWSITRPIQELISISARVAGGDFSTKVHTRRHDEMGVLGLSFNNMVESLNTFITKRNRLILESFSGGLVTADVSGRVTAVNSAAERMLGVRAADAAGRPLREVMKASRAEAVAALAEQALWKGEPVVAQTTELEATEGRPRQELSVTCSPMRDADGQVFGLIVNLRDRAELRRFYEQMNRADRLATLGTFSAGLAHEVRNPLGAIKGTAQLLAEDVRDMPRAAQYAQVIVKEVNRLDRLVREVQEFSQPASELQKPTDLSKLARETLQIAKTRPEATEGQEVAVRENYAALPRTVVSREKLTQALLNVLLNAFQATPAGGEIDVSTEYVEDDPVCPLRVVVRNTGSTIPAEARAQIFEPFFTTKQGGTGLGLSIAYQIVRHHGGELELETGEDYVCFRFKLPLNENDGGENV